jgi:DNA-nicking Smr family endonuclease
LVKFDQLLQAKALFSSQLAIEKHVRGNSLDVHGLSQGAAFIALSIFIKSYGKKYDSFILITGKGLHSHEGNLYDMRNFMVKKIKEKMPHLECQIDPKNEGQLLLKSRM